MRVATGMDFHNTEAAASGRESSSDAKTAQMIPRRLHGRGSQLGGAHIVHPAQRNEQSNSPSILLKLGVSVGAAGLKPLGSSHPDLSSLCPADRGARTYDDAMVTKRGWSGHLMSEVSHGISEGRVGQGMQRPD